MTKKINALGILQKSFRIFFKKPFLLWIFVSPVLLSLVMFLISFPLLAASMYPVYLPTILLSLVMIVFALWLSMVGTGGLILSVEKIVKNQNVKFWKVLDESFRNSVRLSIAYSLEQFFLIIGLIFFIIPGIFFAVRLSLVTPGCILEKKGYGIKRSWNATKGNFWKIFLILAIWNAAFVILGYIPFVSVVNMFLLPVYLTTLTLLYMQLRKR